MELEKEIHQKKFRNEYQKAGLNIIYTSSWLQGLQNTLLKPYGLTAQQYNILRILRGQYPNPASINVLIGRMLDKMSNASRLVEKLLQKGLVERRSSEEDRRKVEVTIKEKGLELLRDMDASIEQMEAHFAGISEEEARVLNQVLDKLRG